MLVSFWYNVFMRIYEHPKSKKIYVDFHVDGVRKRKSTGLEFTKENYELVKKEIVPTLEKSIASGTFELQDKVKSVLFDQYALSTVEKYRHDRTAQVSRDIHNIIHHDFIPFFKSKPISAITSNDIVELKNSMLDKTTASTVKNKLLKLRFIFQEAVMDGIIQTNPFEKVRLPKVKKKQLNPFSKDEIEMILGVASHKFGVFFKVACFTGMRTGELLALRWSNIDFNSKTIDVIQTKSKGIVGYTKNDSSFRTIEMLWIVYDTLKEYSEHKTSEYVFVNKNNKPYYSSDNFNIVLDTILKKLKLEKRTIYNTRHTFASIMLNNGEDIMWVSKILGHASANTTLNNYAYFISSDKKERAPFLKNWHITGTPTKKINSK